MTSARFDTCLAFVLKAEGGFVDDPRDPGGKTNCGITAQTLAEYLGRPVNVDDVKALNETTVAPIYERLFWESMGAAKLPPGVDLFAFDTAVNMGVGTAIRMLQLALDVKPDGDLGPVTLAAPGLQYPKALLQRLAKAREGRYRANPQFDTFGKGWLNRLAATTNQSMKDATCKSS